MKKVIQGKAYVLGTNIDTDQIIPAEHLVYSLTDPEEAKKYGHFALSGLPPGHAGLPYGNIPFISGNHYRSEYGILVAAANFGCGSSREHAPFALHQAGIRVIVAESYARIFYRNAVDGGFVIPLETADLRMHEIKTGALLEIDLENYLLQDRETKTQYRLKPPGDVLPIIEAGGLFPYARQAKMIKNK